MQSAGNFLSRILKTLRRLFSIRLEPIPKPLYDPKDEDKYTILEMSAMRPDDEDFCIPDEYTLIGSVVWIDPKERHERKNRQDTEKGEDHVTDHHEANGRL